MMTTTTVMMMMMMIMRMKTTMMTQQWRCKLEFVPSQNLNFITIHQDDCFFSFFFFLRTCRWIFFFCRDGAPYCFFLSSSWSETKKPSYPSFDPDGLPSISKEATPLSRIIIPASFYSTERKRNTIKSGTPQQTQNILFWNKKTPEVARRRSLDEQQGFTILRWPDAVLWNNGKDFTYSMQ